MGTSKCSILNVRAITMRLYMMTMIMMTSMIAVIIIKIIEIIAITTLTTNILVIIIKARVCSGDPSLRNL